MIWIGIIAWFLLIWIIDCSINPFFIWISIALGVVLLVSFIYYLCWEYSINKDQQKSTNANRKEEILSQYGREIDQWEKKYGRKHPMRE